MANMGNAKVIKLLTEIGKKIGIVPPSEGETVEVIGGGGNSYKYHVLGTGTMSGSNSSQSAANHIIIKNIDGFVNLSLDNPFIAIYLHDKGYKNLVRALIQEGTTNANMNDSEFYIGTVASRYKFRIPVTNGMCLNIRTYTSGSITLNCKYSVVSNTQPEVTTEGTVTNSYLSLENGVKVS